MQLKAQGRKGVSPFANAREVANCNLEFRGEGIVFQPWSVQWEIAIKGTAEGGGGGE